jgi:uncharacterized repeat protein (TIGR01451 family)
VNRDYLVTRSDQGVSSPAGPPVTTTQQSTLVADFSLGMGSGRTTSQTVLFTDTSVSGAGILGRRWDFGDGTTDNSPTTAHTYASSGTFEVTLFVTDTCQITDTHTRQIALDAPALSVGKEAEGALVLGRPLTYTLTIENNGLIDAYGIVLTDAMPVGATFVQASAAGTISNGDVRWENLSVPGGSSLAVTFQVTACQETLVNQYYRVVTSTEQVTSEWGAVVTTPLAIPTIAPSFVYSPSVLRPHQSITFAASATTDGTGIGTWRWEFGDGHSATGLTVTHSYSHAGTYSVTLTAEDRCGIAATNSRALAVDNYRTYTPLVIRPALVFVPFMRADSLTPVP